MRIFFSSFSAGNLLLENLERFEEQGKSPATAPWRGRCPRARTPSRRAPHHCLRAPIHAQLLPLGGGVRQLVLRCHVRRRHARAARQARQERRAEKPAQVGRRAAHACSGGVQGPEGRVRGMLPARAVFPLSRGSALHAVDAQSIPSAGPTAAAFRSAHVRGGGDGVRVAPRALWSNCCRQTTCFKDLPFPATLLKVGGFMVYG